MIEILTRNSLVSVSLRLEGSVNIDVYVVSLFLGERGELRTKFLEMESGNHLVQMFGKNVHLACLVLFGVSVVPQFNLCQGLVGERV